MPGELVLDPFGGIGSTAHVALLMKRRAYSIELSTGYWADSLYYCRSAEAKGHVPTLFDLEPLETT
jgi:DNA modification methylase